MRITVTIASNLCHMTYSLARAIYLSEECKRRNATVGVQLNLRAQHVRSVMYTHLIFSNYMVSHRL